MTDVELDDTLRKAGYEVPMPVIYSWGLKTPRRREVECWLRKRVYPGRGNYWPFPQFIARFQVDLLKIAAKKKLRQILTAGR